MTPAQRKSLYRIAAVALISVAAVFIPGVQGVAGDVVDFVVAFLP